MSLTLSPAADVHRVRAIELRKHGRFDDALAELALALELAPDHPALHYNVALVRLAQDRPGDAAAAWRKAISQKPDYYQAWSGLGIAMRHLGKLNESISA